MTDSVFWGLVGAFTGAVVSLFGIYIAQSNGHLLNWIAKQEHDLNLRKSTPIIDSTVRMTKRQVLPAGYEPFHFIVVSIHNHGDLAAQQLNGHWRMYSLNNSIKEYDIAIDYMAEENGGDC